MKEIFRAGRTGSMMRGLQNRILFQPSAFCQSLLPCPFQIPGKQHGKFPVCKLQYHRGCIASFLRRKRFFRRKTGQGKHAVRQYFTDLVSRVHHSNSCAVLRGSPCRLKQVFIMKRCRRQHQCSYPHAHFLICKHLCHTVQMIAVPVGKENILQRIHSLCQKEGFDPVGTGG